MEEQYQCEKCYEVLTREELEEHVKEFKHYSFKLRGMNFILSYLKDAE